MDEKLSILEFQLLDSFRTINENSIASVTPGYQSQQALFDSVLQCDYQAVLDSDACATLLTRLTTSAYDEEQISLWLIENVQAYHSDEETEDLLYSKELVILSVAVSCLQLFIRDNVLGPIGPESTLLKNSNQHHISSLLNVDSESVYSLSLSLPYLLVARTILLQCQDVIKYCQTWNWWALRAIRAYQFLLEDRSHSLKNAALTAIEVFGNSKIMQDEAYSSYQVQFYIEAGLMMYYYYEPVEAKNFLKLAKEKSHCIVELTGVMGKRTRFQEKDIAQLVLTVKHDSKLPSDQPGCVTLPVDKLPKDVSLSDDTLLDSMSLSEKSDNFVTPLEQALVLALCLAHHRTHEGQSKILTEELQAYIDFVLERPLCWSVQSVALFERCKSEYDSVRKLERSRAQLEELSNQLTSHPTSFQDRLPLVHTVNMQPSWIVKKRECQMLIGMGLTKEALDVSLKLEMWDDVIVCYSKLGRREKAEEVIRAQLAIGETPTLWCYLGDIQNNSEHYIKAWELSGKHFARAQRSLGFLHLRAQKYEECIECFEKSLHINPLQLETWFSYGCACMRVEKFEAAVKAFRRCVLIESDNFQAWNNMSASLVQLKQYGKAFLVLDEALKCDFENWKLWENLLVVGTQCGQFERVLQAYHRLIDLKSEDLINEEVLNILNIAISKDLKDAHDVGSARLRSKVLELYGRLTSKVTTSSEVWYLYAELLLSAEKSTNTEIQRAIQYLQNCHRCSTQKFNWENDVDYAEKVLKQLLKNVTVILSVIDKLPVSDGVQPLASIRLTIKGAVSKIRLKHKDAITNEICDRLKTPCEELETKLQVVLEKIEDLKNLQETSKT